MKSSNNIMFSTKNLNMSKKITRDFLHIFGHVDDKLVVNINLDYTPIYKYENLYSSGITIDLKIANNLYTI